MAANGQKLQMNKTYILTLQCSLDPHLIISR